ncbi:MAG TPA: ABC transporter permease [Blastocatellia bacterium]|nr:ABC transporter permease [Blastocatellia bacterium]
MAIPIVYNLRNLVVRKTTTAMTALGIALTVAVLVADVALVRGLRSVFDRSGDPQHVLVLRKGSRSELTSAITRETYRDLLFIPGIAGSQSGAPTASLEMVTVVNLPKVGAAKSINVTVRGLAPRGIEMRNVRIVQGRWFQAGHREIVIGESIAGRHPHAQLGKTFRFGKGEWQVVGVMDGGQSALDNEIWGDLNQISSDFNRPDSLSSVLIRASDAAAVPALINMVNDDRRFNASAITERAYYDSQTAAGAPLQFLGILVAVIMAVGSGFAAMNTMYAAVSRRASEIGTLRVLGFSRGHILVSFLIESLLLALAGGLLGCLLALPLNHLSAGVGNMITFSEITFEFRVDLAAALAGVTFALLMGAIGGLFPALNAARREILTALREI